MRPKWFIELFWSLAIWWITSKNWRSFIVKFVHRCHEQAWPVSITKSLSLRLNGTPCHKRFVLNILYETKLRSCADNSKVAFNDETDVLFISALFSASKLLLTEQLIGWAGSIITLTVSVRILKLINWMKTSLKW